MAKSERARRWAARRWHRKWTARPHPRAEAICWDGFQVARAPTLDELDSYGAGEMECLFDEVEDEG